MITIFTAQESQWNPKVPYSKTGTFDFRTYNLSLKEEFKLLAENFCLSIHLTGNYNNLKRTQETLKDFIPEIISSIIVDFDNVKTVENRDKILDSLDSLDCSYIIGESRSYNNIDNFNLKGILRTDIKKQDLRVFIDYLKKKLPNLDCSIKSTSSLQAPIKKNKVIKEVNKLPLYFRKNRKTIQTIKDYSPLLRDCLSILSSKGFYIKSEKENIINLYSNSEKTKGGYFIFKNYPFLVRHFNSQKNFSIKDFLSVDSIKQFYKTENQKVLEEFNKESWYTRKIQINERYCSSFNKEYKEIEDKFFNSKNDIIKIKSPMGTGKSNILESFIVRAHRKDLKCLIVTNRISVAWEFKKKYDIQMYLEDYNTEESLIIQFDSLWKINLENYDVVIFDEFISILLHHLSDTGLKSNDCILKVYLALRNKRIILADAFLFGIEDLVLGKNRNCYLIENEFREDLEVIIYQNKDKLVEELISETKVVSCSCNTRKQAKELYEILKKDKRVLLLTGETSEETKLNAYKEFKKSDPSYDVVIYTPTITVGISILNNIKTHYHFDSSNTCDVISSLQMVRRSRKACKIKCYLSSRRRDSLYSSCDREVLEELMVRESEKFIHSSGFIFELDNDSIRLSEIGRYILSIVLISNILNKFYKESFLELLKHQTSNKVSYNNEIGDVIKTKPLEKSSILEELCSFEEFNKLSLHRKLQLSQQERKIPGSVITLLQNRSFLNKDKVFITSILELNYQLSKTYKNPSHIEFLKELLVLKNNNITLKSWYSKKELERLGISEKFLNSLGYKRKDSVFIDIFSETTEN